MKAVIICNGEIKDYTYYEKYFNGAGLIVSVDGGAAHARRLGVKPHVLIGDFDSITREDFEYFRNLGVKIEEFPAEKDMTDTEIAVDFAAEKGCKEAVVIGGLGTRIDHSLSNVFLLKKMLDRGIKGIIVNEYNEVTIINDRIWLTRERDIKITLLPLSEKVVGVTTKGLYYPLHNATIELGMTWGVSNEFTDEVAEVSVKSGLLLVIKSRD
ncbi:MAG: thiamine diphosphokinase [Nitrospiraceae bacterium]|nr:MAG: thiamine diphosphokinase [Nitrospiraceae bacterium]